MEYYKFSDALYVVISEKDLKQSFKTENDFQHLLGRIYNEAVKRNCKRVKISYGSEVIK